jgi:hypothetical protein
MKSNIGFNVEGFYDIVLMYSDGLLLYLFGLLFLIFRVLVMA